MLNASDTALINGGTSKNVPEKDQLGKSRNTQKPSIGAVEYSSGSGDNPAPDSGNTTPGAPSNEDNSNTTPETPSDDNNGNTTPGTPDSGNTVGGGGGCNSFCSLLNLAILFTLKRR
ncbi:MAG: hypothetical protein IJR85_05720 [Synergistaceae bacterium]|nr:hypothetical protein [Synergistaceae bacterium]